MKNNTPQWLGRPIVNQQHIPDLESRAAILEFKSRLPRHHAESRAHDEYLKDQAKAAAAHHLVGMRAAHSAGATEVARNHADMYAAAMHRAGHNPYEEVPADIRSQAQELAPEICRYRPHGSDHLFASEPDQDQEDSKIKDLLEAVQALQARRSSGSN